MRRNLRLWWLCLKDHPGLGYAAMWPLLVLAALVNRKDYDQIHWTHYAAITAAVGVLPWIPVLLTAWTGRHEYEDKIGKDDTA